MCNYSKSFYLVPTRVGMILTAHRAGGKENACPHTRGDDPFDGSLYLPYLLVPTRVGMILFDRINIIW